MKLLLHTCCAPCAIGIVREAKADKFDITGFFYNPNIHPLTEYLKRKKEAEGYFGPESVELISPEYNDKDFFNAVSGKKAPPARCLACWEMRMGKALSFARDEGFDAFTTTLLASPYQDHAALKGISERLSREVGINFYYRDFRKGFKDAHREAREKGMYCQNYCGCIFSLVERKEARKKKLISGGRK